MALVMLVAEWLSDAKKKQQPQSIIHQATTQGDRNEIDQEKKEEGKINMKKTFSRNSEVFVAEVYYS